ncbi:MAG: biopolymer transporter ExbD [Thermoguttaceae bacterium]|nr:biopolymer transporter ExbD [Thermoguttaceae bacterium]
MKSTNDGKPKSLAFNLTPLIDVTFLLIVFFVMSSQMINEETAMEMTLPRETSGEIAEKDDAGKLIVNVPDAESIFLGAKRVSFSELRERFLREKSRATGPLAVRIRTNRDVPYGAIEPILVLCAQTGIYDASFAVVGE